MARRITRPVKIGTIYDLPIYVTVKDVKNYNINVKKDRIDISVPPGTPNKMIGELLESWTPFITEKVGMFREIERLENVRLMKLGSKEVYYSVKRVRRKFEIVKSGDKNRVEIHVSFSYFNEFSSPQSFEEYLRAFILENKNTVLATSQFLNGDYKNLRLESVLIFGKFYPVRFEEGEDNIHFTKDGIIMPKCSLPEEINLLDDFLTENLYDFSLKTLKIWEEATGHYVSEIQIKKYKSKWASIKISKRLLRLNFYLVSVPKECIEATILHELCHLDHPDHQKGFYKELLSFMPEYHELHDVLKHYPLPVEYFKLGFNDK